MNTVVIRLRTNLEESWYTGMIRSLVNLGQGYNVVAVQIIDDGQLHFTGESMPRREGLRKHVLVNRCFDTTGDYIAEDDRRNG